MKSVFASQSCYRKFALMRISSDREVASVMPSPASPSVGSTFNGKSPGPRRLVGRHARLAVDAASAVELFLIEMHLERDGALEGDSALATA